MGYLRRHGILLFTVLGALTALGACTVPEATETTLRDSFAQRIESSSFVADFSRDGDDLHFSGPDGQGNVTTWRVRIDTTLVEPNMFDDAMPYQGRLTSEWYSDGELVEYLGNMTALPAAFLDRGLGQECWAYWVEAEHRWDW